MRTGSVYKFKTQASALEYDEQLSKSHAASDVDPVYLNRMSEKKRSLTAVGSPAGFG